MQQAAIFINMGMNTGSVVDPEEAMELYEDRRLMQNGRNYSVVAKGCYTVLILMTSNLPTCAMRTKSICQRLSPMTKIGWRIMAMYKALYPWNGLGWHPRNVIIMQLKSYSRLITI